MIITTTGEISIIFVANSQAIATTNINVFSTTIELDNVGEVEEAVGVAEGQTINPTTAETRKKKKEKMQEMVSLTKTATTTLKATPSLLSLLSDLSQESPLIGMPTQARRII